MPRTRIMIIALTICLVILFSYLLTDYVKQTQLQNQLTAQTRQSRQLLVEMPLADPALTQRYEESHKANQDVRNTLGGQTVSTTDVIDRILQNAEESHVSAVPFTSDALQEKPVGNLSYLFQPLELSITGTLPDILSFLGKLENPSLYPSLLVTRLAISNANPSAVSQTAPVTGTLSLSLVSGKAGAD